MSNVGDDKDTLNRQETAVAQYAQRMGLEIEVQRYDAGKTGDSAIAERIGFSELISDILASDSLTISSPFVSRMESPV